MDLERGSTDEAPEAAAHAAGLGDAGGPELSDGHLMGLVRAGRTEAYAQLYERHVKAARMVALRHSDNPSDADDMVAEAFTATLEHLSQGKGPDSFFRAYLLTAVTRLSHRRNQKASQTMATDSALVLDQGFQDQDPVARAFEVHLVKDSYESLPERWRAVLWYLEVDGMKPAQIGPLLGLSPNSVSALAVRAREGLRRAYVETHQRATGSEECTEFSRNVAALSRNGLGRPLRKKLEAHAAGCLQCSALLRHLGDVQAGLRGVLFPLVAGVPFAAPGQATAVLAGAGVVKGILGSPAVIGAAVAGLVAAGLIIAGVMNGQAPAPGPVADSTARPVSSPSMTVTPSASPSAPVRSTSKPTPTATTPPTPTPVATTPVLPVPQTVQPPIPSPVQSVPPVIAQTAVPASTIVSRDPASGDTVLMAGFTVVGSQPLSEATVSFTLSGGATFAAPPQAPAGWDCSGSGTGAVSLRCSTGSATRSDLAFTLSVAAAAPTQRGALSYSISGQGIRPAHGYRQL